MMDISSNPPEPTAPRRNRRHMAIGTTAGLLGGGAIGLLIAMPSLTSAAAQDSSTTATTEVVVTDDSGTTDSGTATDSGTSGSGTSGSGTSGSGTTDSGTTPDADPAGGPETMIRSALQNLVDDGTITAAQADAVAADLATSLPRHGGPEGHGHHGRPGFDGEALAGLLGIDVDTLRTELQAGKTIAEIAGEQGVDVQTVIDGLVAEATTHLDEEVAAGQLTQAEADAKLTELTQRITDHVNNGHDDDGGVPPGPPSAAPAPSA